MPDEPAKKKELLLRLLADAETEAVKLESTGQDIARNARLVRDTATPLRTLYSEMSVDAMTDEQWTSNILRRRKLTNRFKRPVIRII